ncbi:hypothetical protein GCM10010497_43540 [Streptomyces cinereoruber]|uniref:Uncharacterized protein n=1 Tax=Streptomyces cinereoruber TaxID=67260 RepID=A0AAV4KMR2_9ACTN|nr:hypothetical protein GCM10010497_43540 [Streptomyces cinereoruber]
MPTRDDPSARSVFARYRQAYPASLRAHPCCFSPTATCDLPYVLLYRKPQRGRRAISSRRNKDGTVVLGPFPASGGRQQ